MRQNGKRPVKKVDSTVKKGDSNSAGSSAVQKYAVSPLNGAKMPIGAHPGTHAPKQGMGVGRKPDEVRAALANIAADKSGFVRDVIDGNVMQKIRIPASTLRKYFTCECGELKVVGDDPHVDVEVDASASVDSRLRAYDTAARYGIGAIREVSVQEVSGRVQESVEVVRSRCAPELAEDIVAEFKKIWNRKNT